MKKNSSQRPFWNICWGLCFIVGFGFLAFWIAESRGFYRDVDFFTFWLGGRMVAQYQDVYNQSLWTYNHSAYGSTWLENPFYVYPLYTAVFFLPLGILPIEFASTIWIFFSFLMILFSLYMSLSVWKTAIWKKMIFPIVITTILFRPAFLIILQGQIDSFLLFVFTAILIFLAKGKNTLANLSLTFFLLKPNIGIPIMGMYGLWLLSRSRWKDIIQIIGFSIFFAVIPLFFDPSWIIKFINSSLYKGQDANLYPTLRGLAGLACNHHSGCSIALWVIMSVLLLGFVVFLAITKRKNISPENVLILSMMVTILVTPYLRAYDLIFLIFPVLRILDIYAQKRWSFIKIYAAYFIWVLLPIGFIFVAVQLNHDILSVLLTLSVFYVYVFIDLFTDKGKGFV